ncbi:MAG: hypothetical protein RLY57_155 [Candidatus Parcubacteria bacterium]|jgi:hypothetical protein
MEFYGIFALTFLIIFVTWLVVFFLSPLRSKKIKKLAKDYKLTYVRRESRERPLIFSLRNISIYNKLSGNYKGKMIDVSDSVETIGSEKFPINSHTNNALLLVGIQKWKRFTKINGDYYPLMTVDEIKKYIETGEIHKVKLN